MPIFLVPYLIYIQTIDAMFERWGREDRTIIVAREEEVLMLPAPQQQRREPQGI